MNLHKKISTTDFVSNSYRPKNMSKKAIICGDCPFPECVEDKSKSLCGCKYLNEKLKELKKD